jgi:hypothetical protein
MPRQSLWSNQREACEEPMQDGSEWPLRPAEDSRRRLSHTG